MAKIIRLSFCLIFSIFLISAGSVNAQKKFNDIDVQEWTSGLVILATGDSIKGAITYHGTEDVIEVIKEDQSISTFSPVNVDRFIVLNEFSGRRQLFRTFNWNLGNDFSDFKKPTFFEQLNEGKYTLILRENYIQRGSDRLATPMSLGQEYDARTLQNGFFVDEIKPLYFVVTPEGDIKSLRRVRKDLLKLCGNKSREVNRYAKKNKLNYEKPQDLTTIINYYNSL